MSYKKTIKKSIVYKGNFSLLSIALLAVILLGCSNAGTKSVVNDKLRNTQVNHWLQSVENYRNKLSQDDPNLISTVFSINDEMRADLVEQFSGLSRYATAQGIAQWLLDENGGNIQYDINATLTPIETYQQQRANCLSFTILLVTMAAELDVVMDYNNVRIPDTWSMDADVGMVFYRHVNAVLKAGLRTHVFDLAMELYDPGYPQKDVSQNYIAAVFMTNRAVNLLEERNYLGALHLAKLAASYDPTNADLWVNLGVIKKRMGNLRMAEAAFLKAYDLNTYSEVVVSNLERLYSEQNRHSEAQVYAKQAQQARLNNPYNHYQSALRLYQDSKYKPAQRTLKKAIILHNKDPRFYELQGLIAQQRGQYRKAVKSLIQAYKLSSTDNQRGKYVKKAEKMAEVAINEADISKQERDRRLIELDQRRQMLQQ